MIIARWSLSYGVTGLPRQWFRVFLYDSVEELREAAVRYHATASAAEFSQAVGMCQESHMFYRDEDVDFVGPIRYARGGFAGVIRLSKENLRLEIVLHEVVHAACIAYRRLYERVVALGDGFESIANEERFAYIYGHMAEHMVLALDELGERQ